MPEMKNNFDFDGPINRVHLILDYVVKEIKYKNYKGKATHPYSQGNGHTFNNKALC